MTEAFPFIKKFMRPFPSWKNLWGVSPRGFYRCSLWSIKLWQYIKNHSLYTENIYQLHNHKVMTITHWNSIMQKCNYSSSSKELVSNQTSAGIKKKTIREKIWSQISKNTSFIPANYQTTAQTKKPMHHRRITGPCTVAYFGTLWLNRKQNVFMIKSWTRIADL